MNDNKRSWIQTNAITIDNSMVYCVDKLTRKIIVISLVNKTIEYTIEFPDCVTIPEDNRSFLFIYGGSISFIPNTESVLYVWKENKNDWESHSLSDEYNKGFYLYSQGRIVGDYLYLFPFTGKNYVKYDLLDNRVESIWNIFAPLQMEFSHEFESINAPAWVDESHIVGCISANNAIYTVDLLNLSIKYHYFDKSGCMISTLVVIGDSLILCDKRNHALYRVNKSNMEITREYGYGNKRAKITSINSNLFLLEEIDTGAFYILNEDFDVIWKNTEALSDGNGVTDGSGIVTYGENIGYYYNMFSKKIYIVYENAQIEVSDVIRELDVSLLKSKIDISREMFKESVFFGVNDFINLVADC